MNSSLKDKREVNTIKLFSLMLPSLPLLIIRLSGTFLRFKSRANKAGKVFKKELMDKGIDRKTATELTDIYMQSSHIRKYIQGFN
jgi:hypothetical protein